VRSHLKKLTESRIKELEQWLDDKEEGDVCNGTIREYKVYKIE
jgi:hypothetical protein